VKGSTHQVQINYYELEGGFWGITTATGDNYIAINFPEQLKTKNLNSEITFIERPDLMSIFQWGKLVEIIGFEVQ